MQASSLRFEAMAERVGANAFPRAGDNAGGGDGGFATVAGLVEAGLRGAGPLRRRENSDQVGRVILNAPVSRHWCAA
jgi:hypothetical protein